MKKYMNNTVLVLKKGGFGKYIQIIGSAIKAYRQSMGRYGEAIIKVKAK